jgi:hypothetical protein
MPRWTLPTLASTVALAWTVAAPEAADARTCVAFPLALDEAPVVFVGTVSEASSASRARTATFRVEEIWKGDVTGTVVVHGGWANPPGVAGGAGFRKYQLGRRYLVAVWRAGGMLLDSTCSATRPFTKDLQRLRPPDARTIAVDTARSEREPMSGGSGGSPGDSAATSCVHDFATALHKAREVFVGTVAEVSLSNGNQIATFLVEEIWKGEVGRTMIVDGGPRPRNARSHPDEDVVRTDAGAWFRTYRLGRRYLVAPWHRGGLLRDNQCSATRRFTRDLERLRPPDARRIAFQAMPPERELSRSSSDGTSLLPRFGIVIPALGGLAGLVLAAWRRRAARARAAGSRGSER